MDSGIWSVFTHVLLRVLFFLKYREAENWTAHSFSQRELRKVWVALGNLTIVADLEKEIANTFWFCGNR